MRNKNKTCHVYPIFFSCRDVSGPKVLDSLEKIDRQALEGNELWHPFGHKNRRRHTRTQKASSTSNRSKTSLQDSDEKLFEL